jgi:hypothetical protein
MLAKAGESDRAIRVKMVRIARLVYALAYPVRGIGVPSFRLDANDAFIFGLFVFPAETPLCWEAKGGQDQPPIGAWGSRWYLHTIFSRLPVRRVYSFPSPFHGIHCALPHTYNTLPLT